MVASLSKCEALDIHLTFNNQCSDVKDVFVCVRVYVRKSEPWCKRGHIKGQRPNHFLPNVSADPLSG